MSLKQMCTCGHDKVTHFVDDRHRRLGVVGACLGMYCDCRRYHDERDETAPTLPPQPWPVR